MHVFDRNGGVFGPCTGAAKCHATQSAAAACRADFHRAAFVAAGGAVWTTFTTAPNAMSGRFLRWAGYRVYADLWLGRRWACCGLGANLYCFKEPSPRIMQY
jgi:hypothetical protein